MPSLETFGVWGSIVVISVVMFYSAYRHTHHRSR